MPTEKETIVSFVLTQKEGEFLVKLARQVVEEYLQTRKVAKGPEDVPSRLLQPCGVFVTINVVKNGEKELRGCIGYPYPTDPLVDAVVNAAISAATQDPRFSPLSERDLSRVAFEVSVLTPPQIVDVKRPDEYPAKITIGEDGLIVEKGMLKGLLLPQVPIEWKWDVEEFLCQCCLKAGLPPDSWLIKGTKIFKFQALVFEEEAPRGQVKRRALDEN